MARKEREVKDTHFLERLGGQVKASGAGGTDFLRAKGTDSLERTEGGMN
jgi:hypothetical protein